MIRKLSDMFYRKRAREWITDAGLMKNGIGNLTQKAKAYNSWRYADWIEANKAAYENERGALLCDNGAPEGFKPRIKMEDGWAVDTSMSLPHLDRLLEQASEIVEERGGHKHSSAQQPFLRNLMFKGDLAKYPAFMDFITSSEVLGTVMDYLETVPVFSKTRPPGARFMESNANLDPDAEGPYRESQFYHLDIHDNPLVYVLVLIEDVTMDCGPWTFLPASVSESARDALKYQNKDVPYRVTDESMYEVVSKEEAITFAYPKGTVLFIDSSRCFHYGSRASYTPRYQLMYAYTSACRGDFSQTFMKPSSPPASPSDSRLRKMVLSNGKLG